MESPAPVHHAVVLAAGNGDRFASDPPRSKLLATIGGQPLVVHTLHAAFDAGVTEAHVVLGFDAERVCTAACLGAPTGLKLFFHLNERWRKENGLSLLAARDHVSDSPFALLMGDHIFDPIVLHRLLDEARQGSETLMAIDGRPATAQVAAEATKVRLDGNYVTAIGKELEPYDALDTGLFVCQPAVFDAVARACADGDTTLSAGIRYLADERLIRGLEIGNSSWCDVDTAEDLAVAKRLVERRVS